MDPEFESNWCFATLRRKGNLFLLKEPCKRILLKVFQKTNQGSCQQVLLSQKSVLFCKGYVVCLFIFVNLRIGLEQIRNVKKYIFYNTIKLKSNIQIERIHCMHNLFIKLSCNNTLFANTIYYCNYINPCCCVQITEIKII